MADTTVWILGAGFSRPLGGPMLAELLAPDSLQNLRATYEEKYERLFDKAASIAHWLFSYGTRFAAGKLDAQYRSRWVDNSLWQSVGERLWWDAEDYLDYLDASVASDTARAARVHLITSFV